MITQIPEREKHVPTLIQDQNHVVQTPRLHAVNDVVSPPSSNAAVRQATDTSANKLLFGGGLTSDLALACVTWQQHRAPICTNPKTGAAHSYARLEALAYVRSLS